MIEQKGSFLMDNEHTSRSARRDSGSSSISVLLVLLLLINTIGLGYLVYRAYQSDNKQVEFTNQVTRLENEIDKLARNSSTTTTSNNQTSSSASITQSSTSTSSSVLAETQGSTTPDVPEAQGGAENTSPEQAQTPSDSTTQEQPTTYVAQEGDSLSLIAENHGLTLEGLMQKNNLTDMTVLIGDELIVR